MLLELLTGLWIVIGDSNTSGVFCPKPCNTWVETAEFRIPGVDFQIEASTAGNVRVWDALLPILLEDVWDTKNVAGFIVLLGNRGAAGGIFSEPIPAEEWVVEYEDLVHRLRAVAPVITVTPLTSPLGFDLVMEYREIREYDVVIPRQDAERFWDGIHLDQKGQREVWRAFRDALRK